MYTKCLIICCEKKKAYVSVFLNCSILITIFRKPISFRGFLKKLVFVPPLYVSTNSFVRAH